MDLVKLGEGCPATDAQIERIAAPMAAGGVAVFPTDTVYGISQAVSANPDGPTRVFAIKRRPAGKVVPWLVAAPEDLDRYGHEVPDFARSLAHAFWPGGLTLVVAASAEVPPTYRAQDGTVALRVPDEPLARCLASVLGSALATTSANTSGLPAPTSFAEVEPRILADVDVAVDGGSCRGGVASTIVSCLGGRPLVTRRGALSEEVLFGAL